MQIKNETPHLHPEIGKNLLFLNKGFEACISPKIIHS